VPQEGPHDFDISTGVDKPLPSGVSKQVTIMGAEAESDYLKVVLDMLIVRSYRLISKVIKVRVL
jgi:hypothetical protein